MTPENFLYWLRGYLELASAGGMSVELDSDQIKVINDHIDLVMTKMTPDRSQPTDVTGIFRSPFSPSEIKTYCCSDKHTEFPKFPQRALTCSAPNIGFRDWRIADPNGQRSLYDHWNDGRTWICGT